MAKRRRLAGMALFGCLLCSCGSGSDAGSGTATVPYNPITAAILDGAVTVEFGASQIVLEDTIVTCMLGEGFEYFPNPLTPESGLGWEATPDTVGEYGLGISTLYFDVDFVGPELLGAANGEGENPNRQVEGSRNDVYRESLSSLEQEPYGDALDQCESLAMKNLDASGFAVLGDDELLYEAVLEAAVRYESQPEVIEYRRGVKQCLADAGFEFGRTLEAAQLIEERLASEVLPTLEPTGLLYEEVTELTKDGKQALGALQMEEVRIAIGLAGCEALRSQLPSDIVSIGTSIADEVLNETVD